MAAKRKRIVESLDVFEGLSDAVLQQHSSLSNLRPASVLYGLLDLCADMWEDKDSMAGKHLLDNLVRFCEELRNEHSKVLWRLLNLVLTAFAGILYGSKSEHISRLRQLNAGMELQDLVRLSKDPKSIITEDSQVPFVRTGLALQGYVDVVELETPPLEIEDMVHLAQVLIQGPSDAGLGLRVFRHEWLVFLRTLFQNLRGVNATPVMGPLKLLLPEVAVLSEKSLEFGVFLDLLYSLSFSELVKASRKLFQAALSMKELSTVATTIRCRIQNSWKDDDEEAIKELNGLLRDLSESDKTFLDLELSDTTSKRLYMVMYTVQLFCLIVLKLVRGTPQRFLGEEEKELGIKWLQGLERQARDAVMSSLRELDYKQAAASINLAISLTEKPAEYRFGVPIW